MAGFTDNGNDKGIRFEYKGCQSQPYRDRHKFYEVTLPEGVTVDDALAVVLADGFKTPSEAAWHEPYARIVENSVMDFSGGTVTVRPSYELIVTYPFLD